MKNNIQILFESWRSFKQELLTELKMEQVLPRFETKAFVRQAEKYIIDFKKTTPGIYDDVTVNTLKDWIVVDVPKDINEKYKPEALNWLISNFIRNPDDISFASRSQLETFYQIKEAGMDRILDKKDINTIHSLEELRAVVGAARPAWREHNNEKANRDWQKGANKIYEDKDWEVYIPENKGAACKLGKGTEWCTAAPGLDYYEQYHKKSDPLIIFISKHNPEEKYQLHYGTEQFMDKNDDPMTLEDRTKILLYKFHKIVASLGDKLPDVVIHDAEKKTSDYKELPNGGYELKKERNYQDGTKHIDYYRYDANGALHSEGRRAARVGYENGNLDYEYWYTHGTIDRADGPAIITYENNKPTRKEWLRNGKHHRINGPAVEDLKYGSRTYHWKGDRISKEEHDRRREQFLEQDGKEEESDDSLQEAKRKLGKPSSETNLGDWFKRKGAPGKKGGWVDCNTCRDGKCKPCGRQSGEKRSKYPRCRPTPSQCKGYKRRHSNLQKEEQQ